MITVIAIHFATWSTLGTSTAISCEAAKIHAVSRAVPDL